MRSSRRWSASAVVAVAILVLAGCSAGGPTPSPQPTGPAIRIADPWMRPTPGGDRPTAVYFRIDNAGDTDDRLLSASTPDASSLELMSTTMESGMTGMETRGPIMVPAGMSVALYPGGDHLMVMGAKRALSVGDTLPLTLLFEHAGKIDVAAVVREG
jgi:copper(I)-binding protein